MNTKALILMRRSQRNLVLNQLNVFGLSLYLMFFRQWLTNQFVVQVAMVMGMMSIITSIILIRGSRLTHSSSTPLRRSLTSSFLKRELSTRSSISGLLEDGQLTEMIFSTMINLTNTLLTTGSKTTHCKLSSTLSNIFSLQNKLLLKTLGLFFDNTRYHQRAHHDGLAGNVKTNENGLFLYKSNQSDALLRARSMDYFFVFAFGGWIMGASHFLLVPMLVAALSLPRKIAVINYFTFHAELLPHTE